MTNEQILEVEKLIADIRVDLALIGTTDADKSAALALKMLRSVDRVLRHIPMAIVSAPDRDVFYNPAIILLAAAEMAERSSDYEAKLVDAVAKQVPLAEANLDKLAQLLKDGGSWDEGLVAGRLSD
jgi:hypothetical protein